MWTNKSASSVKSILITFLLMASQLYGQSALQRLQETTKMYFAEGLNVPGADLNITFKRLPKNLEQFAQSKIEIFSQREELKPGYQTVWAVFSSSKGRRQKKVAVTTDVSITRNILIATTGIRRGTVISSGMVRLVQRRLGKDWKSYFGQAAELVGLEAKQTIKEGMPLTKRLLRRIPLVHRGERIKVEIRNRLLSVSTFGTAIQDGFKDENIKMKLDATGRMVRARVKAAGLAVVNQQ